MPDLGIMLPYGVSLVAVKLLCKFIQGLMSFCRFLCGGNTKNGTGTAIMTTCLQLKPNRQKAAAVLNVSMSRDGP